MRGVGRALLCVTLTLTSFALRPTAMRTGILGSSGIGGRAGTRGTPGMIGRLIILRAGSARSYIVPCGPGLTSATVTGHNNCLHHITVVGRRHDLGPSLLLFSDNSFSRKSPCCSLFGKSMRIKLVGRVGCSTTAVKGRRFSCNVSGVIHLFGVTGFPVIYTGCSFANARLTSVIGPCIVLRHGKLGVNIFKLTPRLTNLIVRGGCNYVRCLSPVRGTGRVARVLGGGRGYSIVVYVSRLN